MPLLIGVLVVAGLAGGAALVWKLSGGRQSRAGGEAGADSPSVKERVQAAQRDKERIDTGGLFAFGDKSVEWAGVGAAAGTLIPIPVLGTALGAALGFFAGAVADAIGQPSYGEAVRAALKSWAQDNGFPATSAAIDALLFRNALLGAMHLYRHKRTGALAVEVTSRADPFVSLFGPGTGEEFIAGPAGGQARQAIMGWSPGMLDGPDQRRANRTLTEGLRVGQLLPIEVQAARSSWRTPGYVWFHTFWPRVARPDPHAVAKSAEWERIDPSPANVDALAAAFDAAAGVNMVQS